MPTIMASGRTLSIDDEEKPLQGDSSEDDSTVARTKKLRTLVGLATAALLIASCALLVILVSPRSGPSTASTNHISVRQLMESPELTNLMAHNYMTFRGDVNDTRKMELVKAGVSSNLADFCGYMHKRDAGVYHQLSDIKLSPAQVQAVLAALRRYGGVWSQQAVNEIAETVQEVLATGGDSTSLKHQLAVKLRPHLHELQGASGKRSNESSDDIDLHDLGFDGFDNWHLELDVSAAPSNSSRTQLVSDSVQDQISGDSTEGMTLAQLLVVFGHIDKVYDQPSAPTSAPERKLMEPMAPTRKLLFEKQKEEMKQGTGKQRFISCLKILFNTRSPKQFCLCLTQKCPMLWAWLSEKFLTMTGKPLTIPDHRRLL